MNHVIAVEGFGGYPFWQKRVPKKIATRADMLCGVGPSQVFNFVIPLLEERSDCVWWYYPQFMMWPIILKIRSILKTKKPEDRIVLIGFSYGGSAVHAATHWFREPVIDLVVSLDPVGKWRINVAPADPEVYRFRKPSSVKRWVNLYQRFDRYSFTPPPHWFGKPIWGGKVKFADRETELFRDDFRCEKIHYDGVNFHGFPEVRNFPDQSHLWFPSHNEVRRQILEELDRLAADV